MSKSQSDSHVEEQWISLDRAAQMLGLEASFLRWALESGLMQGERDEAGKWRLAQSEISAGLDLMEDPDDDSAKAQDVAEMSSPWQSRAAFALGDREPTGSESQLPNGPPEQRKGTGTENQDAQEAPGMRATLAALRAEIAFLRELIKEREASCAAKDQVISKLSSDIARLAETALQRLPKGH
ncbi:MAG: hypothetical protein AAF530_14850 [Pseudomonadota bacterium]